MKKISLLTFLFLSLLVCSCHPDDPVPQSDYNFGEGVFVLNEGTYTYANASLSFYNIQNDSVMNNVFYRVNGAPIGDVGQSLAMINGKLYIVVNNSNYIYKVDANTLVCDTTEAYLLGDFYSPRYMLPLAPNKAYISDLAGRNLWIIDPETMTHTGSIAMGKPTETMVMVGNEVYVTNWSKYYDATLDNNTVMVVDAERDIKVSEIVVGKEPNGMVVDKDGKVWVLCEGAYWGMELELDDWEFPTLWKIDPQTKRATCKISFDATATCLAIDPQGSYMYCFVNGDVRRISVSTGLIDDTFCIPSEGRVFYKMSVNPYNGDLYITDAKNYSVNGEAYRYSSDGVLLSSFKVGICPGFMLFKKD